MTDATASPANDTFWLTALGTPQSHSLQHFELNLCAATGMVKKVTVEWRF